MMMRVLVQISCEPGPWHNTEDHNHRMAIKLMDRYLIGQWLGRAVDTAANVCQSHD